MLPAADSVAIRLCASRNGVPDYSQKLFYLNRALYRHIYKRFVVRGRGGVISEIASLDYEGEIALSGSVLVRLLEDLNDLGWVRGAVRRERDGLRQVIRTCLEEEQEIMFAGDMYPVLGNKG